MMKDLRITRVIPAVLFLLLAGAVLVSAAPPFPHFFQGTVRATPGTDVGGDVIITAVINGVPYGTDGTNFFGRYDLSIPGDDPDTPFVEGAVPGDVIRFYVGAPHSQYALQTSTWAEGGDTRNFDLTFFSSHRFEGNVETSSSWPATGTVISAHRADGSLIISTASYADGPIRQSYVLDVDGLAAGETVRFFIGSPYNEWAAETGTYRVGGWDLYFHLNGVDPGPATSTPTLTLTPTLTPTPTSTPMWCPHVFEGHTYLGVPPDDSGPSGGARLQVFGVTNTALDGRTLLAQTMVDPLTGLYSLHVNEPSDSLYPYLLLSKYHPGYNSIAAQSASGGTVISANAILFNSPACNTTFSENDFWEIPEGLPLPPTSTPTATSTATPTPTATATQTSTPSLGGEEVTVIVQRGREGADVKDSFLNGWDVDTAFGDSRSLGLRSGGWMRPVLWFDLTSIPSDAVVKEATIKLFVESRSNGNSTQVEVYKLLQTWNESETTWMQSLDGHPWEEPGANKMGIDCEAEAAVTTTLRSSPTWLTVDITALVQEWVQNPTQNAGILLKATGAAGVQYNLTASEHWYSARRPALIVTYQVP